MAEKCTKTSSPVERWMNPYPFAPLNHFTVPFSLTKKLLSPLAKNYSSATCLFALVLVHRTPLQDTPSKGRKNFCGVAAGGHTEPTETAPRCFVGGLPATKYGGAAKTKARYRTADTETSILLLLAHRVRRAKHQIIAGTFRLASAKLLKTNMTPRLVERSATGEPRRRTVSI